MVFSITRDAHQVVVVTVHGPLALDDRPVLCRAVEDQLRHQARRVVLDFGTTQLGPVEASTALRVDRICHAHVAACAIVAADRARLHQALADNATGRFPVVVTSLAQALAPAPTDACH